MRFYAAPSWRLVWQILADVFVLAWTVAWWNLGRLVDATIHALAEPSRQVAAASQGLSSQLAEAGRSAAELPLVGDHLREPFDDMAGQVNGISEAAHQQVAGLEQAATLGGLLIFAIPVLLMVALWLPRRIRFAVRARDTLAALNSPNGTDLLALRALSSQPLSDLTSVAADPVRAWRLGDAHALARLADLELISAGVARRAPHR